MNVDSSTITVDIESRLPGPANESWPQNMQDLVRRCTAIDPRARPPMVEVLRMLHVAREELNRAMRHGTPFCLHHAAAANDVEACRLLQSHRYDVNQLNDEKFTPARCAAASNSVDTLRLLLDSGALMASGGTSLLRVATEAGQVGAIKLLLERGAHLHAQLLHIASERGHLETTSMLIDNGLDVQTTNTKGQTPLHCAAARGHLDVVKLLISHGSGVNAADDNWWTPVWLAAEGGHMSVVEHLTGSKSAQSFGWSYDGVTILHVAARKGRVEVVVFLLDRGAVIDAITSDQRACTPLHMAAEEGHASVVRLLLSRQTKVNALDGNQKTALDMALNFGNWECVKALLQEGGTSHTPWRNHPGSMTPLHYAARAGEVTVIRLLLDAEGEGDSLHEYLAAQDEFGQTALHLAAVGGREDVCRVLLDYGASPNVRENDAQTPLHKAAHGGHLDVVKLLLHRGCDVRMTSASHHMTALHFAVEGHHPDVAKFLFENGADEHAVDIAGATPISLASARSDSEFPVLSPVPSRTSSTPTPMLSRDDFPSVVFQNMRASPTADKIRRKKEAEEEMEVMEAMEALDAIPIQLSDPPARRSASSLSDANVTTPDKAACADTVFHTQLTPDPHDGIAMDGATVVSTVQDTVTKAGSLPLLISHDGDVDVINYEDLVLDPKPLGKGGFGTVYGATYEFKRVAVKIFNAPRERRYVEGFVREVAVLSTLHCTNTVLFIGACIDPEHPLCIVTELFEQGELKAKPNMPMEMILHVAWDVAFGLSYLHRKGTIHRDVKPSNVLVDTNGYVLADFGISGATHNTNAGTLLYAAPETLLDAVSTKASDVFSYGVMMWELMAGQKPFDGARPSNTLASLSMHERVVGTWPEYFRRLIEDCTLSTPEKRPSMEEVLHLVNRAREQLANASRYNLRYPLHGAAEAGDVAATKLLLTHRQAAMGKNQDLRTPLHCAVLHNQVDVVELLLKDGAWGVDPDCLDSSRSPLIHAAERGNARMIAILLRNGASHAIRIQHDVNASGSTALHRAAYNKRNAAMKELLAHGADPNSRDKDQITPLHRAADRAHLECAAMLVKAGADVNAVDGGYKGHPIHFAAHAGALQVAKYLHANGADLSAMAGKFKRSPLHYAAERGHVEMIIYLLKAGVDAARQDKDGHTAFDLAKKNRHSTAATMLKKAAGGVAPSQESAWWMRAVNTKDVMLCCRRCNALLCLAPHLRFMNLEGTRGCHLTVVDGRTHLKRVTFEDQPKEQMKEDFPFAMKCIDCNTIVGNESVGIVEGQVLPLFAAGDTCFRHNPATTTSTSKHDRLLCTSWKADRKSFRFVKNLEGTPKLSHHRRRGSQTSQTSDKSDCSNGSNRRRGRGRGWRGRGNRGKPNDGQRGRGQRNTQRRDGRQGRGRSNQASGDRGERRGGGADSKGCAAQQRESRGGQRGNRGRGAASRRGQKEKATPPRSCGYGRANNTRTPVKTKSVASVNPWGTLGDE